MSRRARALVFALLAGAAAAVAAALANGYGSSIARSFGPLRPVVVVRQPLRAGRSIGPGMLQSSLEVRRVPARFVPPGTLTRPGQALGLEPRADVASGAYLTAAALRSPAKDRGSTVPRLGRSRRPVAIEVSGTEALLVGGAAAGGPVDVVVTSEPTGPGPGRTYVAAASVPLLALEAAGGGTPRAATATLGLTRPQALELIAAENFARQVTLLPAGGR